MATQAQAMQDMNAWLKAGAVWLAMVAVGWFVHVYQVGGDARPGLHDPRAVFADRATDAAAAMSRGDAMRAEAKASGERMALRLELQNADVEDRREARRWSEAFPRNDAECSKMTMDASVWKMRQHGCILGGGELPPAIFERGETVRVDDAMRSANRRPTQVGAVGDQPRDVAFCAKAMTTTPRVELWRNGCLLWGDEPRIQRVPSRPLDEALAAIGIEPTKPGPIPDQAERDDGFCSNARNTANPVQLWRYGCLPRGTFAPFIEPELRLDEALREALPAPAAGDDSAS